MPGWFSVTSPSLEGVKSGTKSLVVRGGNSGYLGWFVGDSGSDATKVRLRLRSSRPAAIGVHLCEKNLTQSVGCRNGIAKSDGGGVWSWQEVRLSPRVFERPRQAIGPVTINRPLFLSLGTASYGKDVEIDEIELLTDDDQVTWATTDFRAGLPVLS